MDTAISIEEVKQRLSMMGFDAASETDDDEISFLIEKVTNYTMNYCYIGFDEIPEIIRPKMLDKIAAGFLYERKNFGQLTGFDYSTAIREIREGDTTIQYGVGESYDTPESRFDWMVRELDKAYDKWITPYRKLRW